MDVFQALYTTRAMRRVKPDPVPEEVVKQMLDAAIRAPSPGNTQQWRFLIVTDVERRARLGELYRLSWDRLTSTIYSGMAQKAEERGDDQTQRVLSSAEWLADNFADVPLVVLAFTRNDPDGSSIYPAVWSLMLAARAHGIGSTLTTVLSHFAASDVYELLGVPTDKGWRLAAAVPCGYPLGRWGVAPRPPLDRFVYSDEWGRPPGWDQAEPLWNAVG